MKNRERKYFSVFDIFIILIALLTSIFTLVSQFNSNEDAVTCVVRVEGKTVHSIPLANADEPVLLEIDGEYPLTVCVNSDSVRVINACCPDKLCEHSGSITRTGQSVVCLPAKVSVTLENNDNKNELDAVVG